MAQKSLVMRPLTEKMIRTGENLLRLLVEQRFPFRAALWLYLTEAEEWRLFLAVPKARAEGKIKFYKRLLSLIEKERDVPPLLALSVVDAKDPLIYSLGAPFKVGDVTGHQFSRGTINGRSFDDAHIYPRANKILLRRISGLKRADR